MVKKEISVLLREKLNECLSTIELRDLILNNLEEVLTFYTFVPDGLVDITFLEALPQGTYRLQEPPTVELLEMLPQFNQSSGEVGLYHIDKTWIIVLSHKTEIILPRNLHAIWSCRYFRHDSHSHPGVDIESSFPSFQDLNLCFATKDGNFHISTSIGLLELHYPTTLPGGFSAYSIYQGWKHWITKELHLTKEAYELKPWKFYHEFLERFFFFQVIPWNHKSDIQRILEK